MIRKAGSKKWKYPPISLLDSSIPDYNGEIPVKYPTNIPFKQIFTSPEMKNNPCKLAMTLGMSEQNQIEVVDLREMVHVLIGGTTGSGKSMLLNTWICSLLMRTTPNEVRIILIDPIRVELSRYNGIPHLLTPVIQEPDKCISALLWAMKEMDRRYDVFTEIGVRNIDAYNELSGFEAMPFIVIIVDEFSDLMAYNSKETDDMVSKLAMMSRVVGIHLIISTSRVGKDVYPDVMSAQVQTHIAFNTFDSEASKRLVGRYIKSEWADATVLLGSGDMFFEGFDKDVIIKRVQGAFISEGEIQNIVSYLKKETLTPVTL